MKKFILSLSELTRIQKIILLLLLVLVVGILYFNLSHSIESGMIASLFAAVLLWLTQNLWTPYEYRKPRLAYFSFGGFLSAATALVATYNKSKDVLAPFYKWVQPYLQTGAKQIPLLKSIKISPELINTLIIVMLLIIFFLINYIFRRDTIVLPHEVPIKKDIPDLDFNKKLLAIGMQLEKDLDKIDTDTNWDDYYFTPIDAEVELYQSNRVEKKITDLMAALRKNKRTDAFLVLGDPGSGKSVALRKLCKEIIQEVKNTGRIPLYVNLKEWEPERKWTESDPPKPEELQNFVLNNLKSKLFVLGNKFFDDYYFKLHEQGRIYYIMDSFDEIPALLDEVESSWLVDRLSHLIYIFITSGYQGRGILASRIFRKPSEKFAAKTLLEIRPMSDLKIKENLEKSGAFTEETIRDLYKDRGDLIPLASNPFMAALLTNYVKTNKGSLPKMKSDLFKNYIDGRLQLSKERINTKGQTEKIVIEYSTKIAEVIFSQQQYGLEIPLNDLKQIFSQEPVKIEDVVNVLVFANIGRLGTGVKSMFSFVHRRFNEYFVVQSLLQDDKKINLQSIPKDSRYRDALVLYCEVAPSDKALSISNFCWDYIHGFIGIQLQLTNEKHKEVALCLRFLRDAFSLRKDCVEHFRDELSKFIFLQINSENFIVKKIAVESSGLLEKPQLEQAILIAFKTGNPHLQEAAFKAAKNIITFSKKLERALTNYLLTFEFIDFFIKKKELLFSLQLSPFFKRVFRTTKLLAIDQYLFLLGIVILLSVPKLDFILLFLFITYQVFNITRTDILSAVFNNLFENRKKQKEAVPNLTIYRQSNNIMALRAITAIISFREIFPTGSLHIGKIAQACYLLACIMVFPFLHIRIAIDLRVTIRRTFVGFLLLAGAFLCIRILEMIEKDLSDNTKKIIFFGIVIGTAAVFIWFIFTEISDYFKDLKTLRSISYYDRMDREKISHDFYSFHFANNRQKFVKKLQTEVKTATGHWPNNTLPNYNNDESSSLLMDLEEKWLGLGR